MLIDFHETQGPFLIFIAFTLGSIFVLGIPTIYILCYIYFNKKKLNALIN